MKWIKLRGKHEPAFDERYLWINSKGEWWDGILEEIKQTSTGKIYIVSDGLEGNTLSDATPLLPTR